MANEVVYVRMSVDTKDKLGRLARHAGVTMPEYIRQLIEAQCEDDPVTDREPEMERRARQPMPQRVRDELAEESRSRGEFVDGGTAHVCPQCGSPTEYRVFSGGREWECVQCDAQGEYPGAAPSRAGLLATTEGRAALRAQMRTHLDGLRGNGAD